MRQLLLASAFLAVLASEAAGQGAITASSITVPYSNGTGASVLDGSAIISGLKGANLKGTSGTTLFIRPGINIPNGTTLYSASDDFSTPKSLEIRGENILLAPTKALSILPPPGIFDCANAPAQICQGQGLYVVQTGPASGTQVGPLAFNRIDTTWRSTVTGDGSFGQATSGSISSLSASLNVGGPNFNATSAFGIAGGVNQLIDSSTNPDLVGVSGGVYLNAKTKSVIFGGSSGATIGPNGSTNGLDGNTAGTMVGHEVDLDIESGGQTKFRYGFNSANQGLGVASQWDSAYNVATLGFPGATTGRWKNAFTLSNQGGNLPPSLADDANFFASDHNAKIANWAKMDNINVTGNILWFPSVILAGDGKLTTSGAVFYASPPSVSLNQVGFGGATVAASNCGSLPGSTGCLVINVGGSTRFMPFY